MASRSLDLRLAAPLVGLWLGIGGFLAVETGWRLAIGFAVLLTWVGLHRTGRSVRWFLGFCCLGFALGAVRCGLLLPALPATGHHQLVFEINGDAQPRTARFGSLDFRTEYSYSAELLQVDDVPVRSPILLTLDDGSWQISSRGTCAGNLRAAEQRRRYVGFGSCRGPTNLLRQSNRLQRAANSVRAAEQAAVAGLRPTDGAALLPGLVLGDTSMLSDIDAAAMQRAGLGHLTAVSGANVAILVLALQQLLRRSRLPLGVRVALLLVSVAGFVVVVRPTASVVRAAAMAAVGLLVLGWGRRGRPEAVLLFASLALLVIDPWLAASWGFALSVAATAGLVLLAPNLAPAGSPWWRQAGAVALAAGLATLPVLVLMGAAPTFAAIPANLLAELLVAPATVSGLLAAALFVGTDWLPIGGVIAWLARVFAQIGVWSASGILQIADTANRSWLSLAVVSPIGLLAVLLAGGLLLRTRRLAAALAGLLVVVALPGAAAAIRPQWPPADWQVIACDVGQGDATLIRSGETSAYVVDAGPDELAIADCLDRAGVESIDLFIASHFHADHVGGAAGLVRGRDLQEVWLSCGSQPVAGIGLVRRVFAGIPSRLAAAGMRKQAAAVSLTVLACPAGRGDVAGSSVNNTSLALVVQLPSMRLLLVGDAEQELQERLMQQVGAQQFDLLKVPHHGSKSQASSFAQWTGAKAGWISVAAQNDFGHPALETVQEYQRIGVKLWRTSQCGSIAFTAAGLASERACQPG